MADALQCQEKAVDVQSRGLERLADPTEVHSTQTNSKANCSPSSLQRDERAPLLQMLFCIPYLGFVLRLLCRCRATMSSCTSFITVLVIAVLLLYLSVPLLTAASVPCQYFHSESVFCERLYICAPSVLCQLILLQANVEASLQSIGSMLFRATGGQLTSEQIALDLRQLRETLRRNDVAEFQEMLSQVETLESEAFDLSSAITMVSKQSFSTLLEIGRRLYLVKTKVTSAYDQLHTLDPVTVNFSQAQLESVGHTFLALVQTHESLASKIEIHSTHVATCRQIIQSINGPAVIANYEGPVLSGLQYFSGFGVIGLCTGVATMIVGASSGVVVTTASLSAAVLAAPVAIPMIIGGGLSIMVTWSVFDEYLNIQRRETRSEVKAVVSSLADRAYMLSQYSQQTQTLANSVSRQVQQLYRGAEMTGVLRMLFYEPLSHALMKEIVDNFNTLHSLVENLQEEVILMEKNALFVLRSAKTKTSVLVT